MINYLDSAATHFSEESPPEAILFSFLSETPKEYLVPYFLENREKMERLIKKERELYKGSGLEALVERKMEIWEKLAETAIRHIGAARLPKGSWTIGGGTSLMLTLRHRRSRDVDVFLADPQLLAMVSPRLTDISEYPECEYIEQMNFTKIQLPDGEIDFILAGKITDMPEKTVRIGLLEAPYEHPFEVIAKKIRYRGKCFTPRDVFDLAAMWRSCGEKMIPKLNLSEDDYAILEKRISVLRRHTVNVVVDALPGWEALQEKAYDVCQDFLEAVDRPGESNFLA